MYSAKSWVDVRRAFEHAADWFVNTAAAEVSQCDEVAPGEHRVQFKVRSRGTRDYGATSEPLTIRTGRGDTVNVLARVPIVNGYPRTLCVRSRRTAANAVDLAARVPLGGSPDG